MIIFVPSSLCFFVADSLDIRIILRRYSTSFELLMWSLSQALSSQVSSAANRSDAPSGNDCAFTSPCLRAVDAVIMYDDGHQFGQNTLQSTTYYKYILFTVYAMLKRSEIQISDSIHIIAPYSPSTSLYIHSNSPNNEHCLIYCS